MKYNLENIKPDYSELARLHEYDRRTIKKFYKYPKDFKKISKIYSYRTK